MNTLIRLAKRPTGSSASAQSIQARFKSRLRIPAVTVHPVLRGDRNYLRALRAAEMAAWEVGLPLRLGQAFADAIAAGHTTR